MPATRCSYGTCKNDKRYSQNNIKFIKFPSVKLERTKCSKWVKACGRLDLTMKELESRYSNNQPKRFYVCSSHFVDANGPTKSHPDPIPNFKLVTKTNGRRRNVVEETSIYKYEDYETKEAVKNLLIVHNISEPIIKFEDSEATDMVQNLITIPNISEPIKNEETARVAENEIEKVTSELNCYVLINRLTTKQLIKFNCQPDNLENTETFLDFDQNVVCPKSWVKIHSPSKLELMKLGLDDVFVVVKFTLNDTFGTSIKVLNSDLDENHELNQLIPKIITSSQELNKTVTNIDKWKICIGNPDKHLKKEYLSKIRNAGYICSITHGVKSSNCPLIFYPKIVTKSVRCQHCQDFRSTLQKAVSRGKKKSSSSPSRLKYKSLPRKDLIKKIKEAKKIEVKLKRKLVSIEKKINQPS